MSDLSIWVTSDLWVTSGLWVTDIGAASNLAVGLTYNLDMGVTSDLAMGFELRVQNAHTPKCGPPTSFFAPILRDLGRR